MAEKSEVRERAEATITVSASAFPLELFKEWEADCKSRFGDCRWIKMWNDHMRAKDYDFYSEVLERIRILEQEVQKLKKETVKEESVKTFTQKL